MIEKPIYRYRMLDAGKLCKLFRNPGIHIPSGDGRTPIQEIVEFIHGAVRSNYFYIIGRDPRYEAFIYSAAHNFTTYNAHYAIREDKRDNLLKRMAESAKWVFTHTPCQSIMALVREENRQGRALLPRVGMRRVGQLTKSVTFNGELVDEIIYQATAEEFNKVWGEELGGV